jgi:hypothetical protein
MMFKSPPGSFLACHRKSTLPTAGYKTNQENEYVYMDYFQDIQIKSQRFSGPLFPDTLATA